MHRMSFIKKLLLHKQGGPSRGAFVEPLGAAAQSSRVMGWYVKYKAGMVRSRCGRNFTSHSIWSLTSRSYVYIMIVSFNGKGGIHNDPSEEDSKYERPKIGGLKTANVIGRKWEDRESM